MKTSPWKLNLVAKLVRRMWLPEALDQLTFVNKKVAPMIREVLNKAAEKAETELELVPEEMEVERCFATPAPFLKRLNYHAKGKAGLRKVRYAHLNVTLAPCAFDDYIEKAKHRRARDRWTERRDMAHNKRVRVLGEFAFPNKESAENKTDEKKTQQLASSDS